MLAVLFLILIACLFGAGAGLLAAAAIWLRLIFTLLDLLVQQVPRGVMLFVRLATWAVVRLAKLVRYMWLQARRVGLWAAQHAYARLFVWSYRLRSAYVAGELRQRDAH